MFRGKTGQGRAKYEIATFDATEDIFNDATDARTRKDGWINVDGGRKAVGWRATQTALLAIMPSWHEAKEERHTQKRERERERETER